MERGDSLGVWMSDGGISMKYKPGTKWSIYPTAQEELKQYQDFVQEL